MFICAEISKNVQTDELLVLKQAEHGGIGVYRITGEQVGHIIGKQPAGCADYWAIAAATETTRVLCSSAIVCGRILFLSSDSPLLNKKQVYKRVEVAGYGMMVEA